MAALKVVIADEIDNGEHHYFIVFFSLVDTVRDEAVDHSIKALEVKYGVGKGNELEANDAAQGGYDDQYDQHFPKVVSVPIEQLGVVLE